MALNFPDPATQTPVNTFSPTSTPSASTNGITYLWDGQKWNAQTNSDAAFWQRVGTTLSPANVGDNISTTGEVKAPSLLNAATTGDPNITLNADGSTLIRNLQNTSSNLVTNGAMRVAQRSTIPVAKSGYQTVDRWQVTHSGSDGSVTQTQGSTGGPAGFPTFYRITNTSTTTATNGYRQIIQFVEAQDVVNSGWIHTDPTSNLSLSFKVRASVSQLYYGRIYTDDGTAYTYPFRVSKPDGTAIDADTWTDITVPIPGNASLVIDNDNGIGLGVIIAPHYGSDSTETNKPLNTWAAFSNTSLTPDYATTWATTAGATFDITAVQLTATDVPVEFQHEDYGTTLAKCQRYFYALWSVDGGAGSRQTMPGLALNIDGVGNHYAQLPAVDARRSDMRSPPTVEFHSGLQFAPQNNYPVAGEWSFWYNGQGSGFKTGTQPWYFSSGNAGIRGIQTYAPDRITGLMIGTGNGPSVLCCTLNAEL